MGSVILSIERLTMGFQAQLKAHFAS